MKHKTLRPTQGDSPLGPLVASKRGRSRRGTPMWVPGGGRPRRAAPTKNDFPTHRFGIDTVLGFYTSGGTRFLLILFLPPHPSWSGTRKSSLITFSVNFQSPPIRRSLSS